MTTVPTDVTAEVTASARRKPRLRGVSHEVAFYLSLIATTWLLVAARGALRWSRAPSMGPASPCSSV